MAYANFASTLHPQNMIRLHQILQYYQNALALWCPNYLLDPSNWSSTSPIVTSSLSRRMLLIVPPCIICTLVPFCRNCQVAMLYKVPHSACADFASWAILSSWSTSHRSKDRKVVRTRLLDIHMQWVLTVIVQPTTDASIHIITSEKVPLQKCTKWESH